jgi:hypothetical protein
MPTDPPKKKAALKKAMKASDLLDPGASEHDKKVAQTALPVLQDQLAYIGSPTYLRRLRAMGVENPEAVQQERLQATANVKFGSSKGANMNFPRNWDGEKSGFISVDLQTPETTPGAVIAHELNHQTSRKGAMLQSMGQTPRTATGTTMAPVESWPYFNRANLPTEMKQRAFQAYQSDGKMGIYPTDPGTLISNAGMDEHGKDVTEHKGDMEALRYLLFKRGITKSYGEDIDGEKLKRAMQDPQIKGDKFFKRLSSKFDPAALIYLNNNVAKAQQAGSNLA